METKNEALVAKLAVVADRITHGDAGIDSVDVVHASAAMLRAQAAEIERLEQELEQLTGGGIELPKQEVQLIEYGNRRAAQAVLAERGALKPEKERDYRRVIKKLQSQGFTVDNLLRYLNKIKEEVENKTQT